VDVDTFQAAGIKEGAPGQRRPHYCAAFVLDPDGDNIEAVFGSTGVCLIAVRTLPAAYLDPSPSDLGRPPVSPRAISEIEALAASTDLSIRQTQKEIASKVSRGVVGEISKRVRAGLPRLLTTFYTYLEPTPATSPLEVMASGSFFSQ
jgi:hypothetical protein